MKLAKAEEDVRESGQGWASAHRTSQKEKSSRGDWKRALLYLQGRNGVPCDGTTWIGSLGGAGDRTAIGKIETVVERHTSSPHFQVHRLIDYGTGVYEGASDNWRIGQGKEYDGR